jgi:multicomponent Na+:H+ antiporter subunit C
MHLLMAITVGLMYAAGLYMMLRRSIIKLLFGLVLLSHGSNLLIFTAAKLTEGNPPLIRPGQDSMNGPHTDPLPPALILTAIVISFAILAFACVLVKRGYEEVGTDDQNEMSTTDL